MSSVRTTPLFVVGMTVLSLAVVTGIGWLDYVTGDQIGFSIFYLIPVTAITFLGNRFSPLLLAFYAAGCWTISDALWHPDALGIVVWNGVTRLVMYTALAELLVRVRRDRQQLRVLLDNETKLARTDALTGLANRREFVERMEAKLARALREGTDVCMLYLDLDGFKALNDHYGHDKGDEVLRQVAIIFRKVLRATDVPARLGGDEFVAYLWKVEPSEAGVIAERVRAEIAALGLGYPKCSLGASIGVAYFERAPASVEVLLSDADAVMYEAKREGKNRIAQWRSSRPAAQPETNSSTLN